MLITILVMAIAVAVIIFALGIWQHTSKSNDPNVKRKRAEHIASVLFWGTALIFVILAFSSVRQFN